MAQKRQLLQWLSLLLFQVTIPSLSLCLPRGKVPGDTSPLALSFCLGGRGVSCDHPAWFVPWKVALEPRPIRIQSDISCRFLRLHQTVTVHCCKHRFHPSNSQRLCLFRELAPLTSWLFLLFPSGWQHTLPMRAITAVSVHRMVSPPEVFGALPWLILYPEAPDGLHCVPTQIIRTLSAVCFTGFYSPAVTHQNMLWVSKDGEVQNSSQNT